MLMPSLTGPRCSSPRVIAPSFAQKQCKWVIRWPNLLSELAPENTALLNLLQQQSEVPFPTALAAATVALQVPAESALLGMLFSWAENQVLACVKSVPLGQVAGQRLLLSLTESIEAAAVTARTLADHELSNWSPGLSLLSMQHEVQYSRLYRS
jgi:urease accessory protein